MKKMVVYIRVSTKKQGASGLGIEAQRKICNDFIVAHEGEMVAEYMDVESGTHRDRKGLADAVSYCKRNECALVVAKLDRLARDVEFCFKIVNTGIEIHFVDMPQVSTLLLGVFASVAQYERELTSDRTKKALTAKAARGEKTGGATDAWVRAWKDKSNEELAEEYRRRGATRNERFLARRDVVATLRVLHKVFPNATESENAAEWHWGDITTRGEYKDIILGLMRDYKEMDETGKLFVRWNFKESNIVKLQVKLCAWLQTIRKSLAYNQKLNNNE